MRIVVASDSFKGSLSSAEIIECVSTAVSDLLPNAEVVGIPMADGGEGTVEALVQATGGMVRQSRAIGPLGAPLDAVWGLLPTGMAVIEMAAASGLPLVPETLRNPLLTTTRGTGELVLAALDAGAKSVMLALGGSATNDGGMGALSALGVVFRDAMGNELFGMGADLERVALVDATGIDQRLSSGSVDVRVMCDVDNPLLGPDGAAATFAPQKGADATMVAQLEDGMASFAHVACDSLGVDFATAVERPGSGAAGGLGFALDVFLGSEMGSGIEAVLDAVAFDDAIAGADLVITGEGRLDAQTAHGKVVVGVARHCRRAGVPCLAIVGSSAPEVDVSDLELVGVFSTAPEGMPVIEAMQHARELYASGVKEVLRTWMP